MDVDINKILPVVEIKEKLEQIVKEVANSDNIYLATLDGLPSAIIVGVHHLEKLTGKSHEDLMPDPDFEKAKDDTAVMPIEAPIADTTPAAMPSDSPAVEDPFITPYQSATPAPVPPTSDIVPPAPAADSATMDTASPDLIVPPADDMAMPVDDASADLMTSGAAATATTPVDDIFTVPNTAQASSGASMPTPAPMDQPVGPAPAQSTVGDDSATPLANPPTTPPTTQI